MGIGQREKNMDWLNIASGGLLGLVGSVTGAVMKYFQTGQTQAFEEKKMGT